MKITSTKYEGTCTATEAYNDEGGNTRNDEENENEKEIDGET